MRHQTPYGRSHPLNFRTHFDQGLKRTSSKQLLDYRASKTTPLRQRLRRLQPLLSYFMSKKDHRKLSLALLNHKNSLRRQIAVLLN